MMQTDQLPTPPPESAGDAAASARERRQNQALFRIGLIGLVLFCVYFGLTAEFADPLHLYSGLAIAIIGVLPSLFLAKRARHNLPLLEVFILTSVNTYAIPLLSGHEELARCDASRMTNALSQSAAFPARWLGALAVTILGGWICWRCIEQPFERRRAAAGKRASLRATPPRVSPPMRPNQLSLFPA